jgi:hypothetical protein
MGLDDGTDLFKPVNPENVTQLLYLRPYKQDNIKVEKFVDKINDARFGLLMREQQKLKR